MLFIKAVEKRALRTIIICVSLKKTFIFVTFLLYGVKSKRKRLETII